ncbi:MAG: electron transfer flavoprotein subunit beta/FixA family protein [Bacillota bacterium]|nr:electron transfer flavoprotein subunit beta/FixA family protein [Bacillota bacterium]
MTVVVCVKPVPEPQAWRAEPVDPSRGTPRREGIPLVLSPGDRRAIELALGLSAGVLCLAMGPPEAEAALRQGLAVGATRAVLVSDRRFAGADTLLTARVLALAVGRLGAGLVLCGGESPDSGTGSVPVQLGTLLGWPVFTAMYGIGPVQGEGARAGSGYVLECRMESGLLRMVVEPPLVGALHASATPLRSLSPAGIVKARGRPLEVWDAATLGWEGPAQPYTSMLGWERTPVVSQAEMLPGDWEEAARLLAGFLRQAVPPARGDGGEARGA